jgi:N-acyl-D-aspartate/D-glutamate deacylase
VSAGRLLIRGGTVIDGSGGAPYVADVLLADGIIAAVGPDLTAPGPGVQEVPGAAPAGEAGISQIDATGLLVTPGFIDVHTHYDGQATWEHTLGPSSGHGVTTVVMGNCGVGFAPCRPASRNGLVRLMEGIEDIPEVVMTAGLPWAWQTFPEYLDFLAARRFDVDLAAQLPHAALRVYVMGARGMAREPATEADMAQMRDLAQEAVEAGAVGFSTSRSVNHKSAGGEPTPSFEAAERELYLIADGLTRSGRGVLQVITEFPAPDLVETRMRLLIGLARASGRPLSFTLAQFHSAPRSWPEVLRRTEEAHAAGVPIRGQVFPRPMGLLMGLDTSRNPFQASPSYAALAHWPVEQRAAAMREPGRRARIIAESEAAGLRGRQRDFDWVFPLRGVADYEPAPGDSVAALARARGVSPAEIAYDIMLERDGQGMLWAGFANIFDGSLDPVLRMMKSPATIIGLGDGGAHYGLICDSSFPTFLLSFWGRDRTKGERLPVPSIVKSLTSEAAAAVGLDDRGLIRPGYKADLNLIDFDALTLHVPRVRHDLPSGGRRLTQAADGYRATIVSGAVTYRDGQATGELPGRLVRGPRRPGGA